MGPWEIIGVTFWGGTMVICEGTPIYPQPDRLWQMIDRHKVNTLGISPTAVRGMKSEGDEWVDKHDLSSLRLLGSTGEPLGSRQLHVAVRKGGQEEMPDHQHLRRNRNCRRLANTVAAYATQTLLSGRTWAGHGY